MSALPALLDFLPSVHPIRDYLDGWETLTLRSLLVPTLIFWLALEAGFFLLIIYLHRQLDKCTAPPSAMCPPNQIIKRVVQILDDIKELYPFDRFVALWCGAKTMKEVKEGNFRLWLAWALFSKHLEDLTPQEYQLILESTELLQKRYNHRLDEGFNPSIKPIRMTLDPLHIIHRPLLFYLCISFIPRLIGEAYLAMLGFTKLRLMDTNYWYRPASAPCAELPLVFFHGVGPGVCAYGGLVNKLAADRSAVLIEIPHITMSLEEFRAKNAEEVVSMVRAICHRHEIDHFCVAGHSYGTILAGWVIKGMREEVKQAVLVDPVCFLLCLPTTTLNFLYSDRLRKEMAHPAHLPAPWLHMPKRTHKLRFLDFIIHYFVSREITVANAMRRQFWWYTKILYMEDLHCPAVVGLASDDALLAAHAVRKHLEPAKGRIKLLWWEGLAHGEFLTDGPGMDELDAAVREQEKQCYHLTGSGIPPVWEGTGHRRQRPKVRYSYPAVARGGFGGQGQGQGPAEREQGAWGHNYRAGGHRAVFRHPPPPDAAVPGWGDGLLIGHSNGRNGHTHAKGHGNGHANGHGNGNGNTGDRDGDGERGEGGGAANIGNGNSNRGGGSKGLGPIGREAGGQETGEGPTAGEAGRLEDSLTEAVAAR